MRPVPIHVPCGVLIPNVTPHDYACYPSSSLGSLGWPHKLTLVIHTHFVLTHAHP
jgi:hypothetical protein